MKIERVNDRQIRCTLTGDDLANRQLKISELAYGSEKAKNLFRDMMRQAEYECGFEAEDIPLVIEAIPVSSDCIVLIITKVEDPEELDTRFSRFAPSVHNSETEGILPFSGDNAPGSINELAEGMINMLKEVKASFERRQSQSDTGSGKESESAPEKEEKILCILECDSLSNLVSFAKAVKAFYHEDATLYREPKGAYQLLLSSGSMGQKEFARVYHAATEFGHVTSVNASRISYMQEHFDLILQKDTIEALSRI